MADDKFEIPVEVDAAAASNWRAVCNGHIGGWMGPCRTFKSDARSDADVHDREGHGGDDWAVVIRSSCRP